MANFKTDLRSSKIFVSSMQERDLGEVLAIEKASFQTPWTKRMFLSDLNSNSFARSVVARLAIPAPIVGYACFWVLMEELHLMNLAVHPDFRRQKIGEELIYKVMGMGRQAGCRTALLEVRLSNGPARQLYEKLGFKVVGTRRGYYREPKEDALIMLAEPLPTLFVPVPGEGGPHG